VLLELSVVEQRYEAVMEVLRDGLAITEVALRYGVTRQSVHAWIRRYHQGGIGGLADRSHRPKSCPHQMTVEVEALLCEMRRKQPRWGPRRLVYELERAGIDAVPSRASVYRALVRNKLVSPVQRRRRKEDYRQWERSQPMELWQMDCLHGPSLADGTVLRMITGVDDHSRFCVLAEVVHRATARAVCAAFSRAMGHWGIPDEVLTDNGKVFTARFSKHGGQTLFDDICQRHGIAHRLTAVRSPTTTGKIERFHKTLRSEFLDHNTFATIEDAQARVDAWLEEYNTVRPHQAISMRTPAQRFRAGDKTVLPTIAKGRLWSRLDRKPVEQDRSIPGLTITRRVTPNGRITVTYQHAYVDRRLAGKVVTVRVEPNVMHAYYDGVLIKSIPRTTQKEVKQLAAHDPHNRPNRT